MFLLPTCEKTQFLQSGPQFSPVISRGFYFFTPLKKALNKTPVKAIDFWPQLYLFHKSIGITIGFSLPIGSRRQRSQRRIQLDAINSGFCWFFASHWNMFLCFFCHFFATKKKHSYISVNIYIYIYLEPKWPLFWLKFGSYCGGLGPFKNRGQLGFRCTVTLW